MVTVKPFRGWLANPKLVSQLVSPPYDVIDTEEARLLAKNNPYCFLHVKKPEIDLPESTDPYS